MDGPALEAFAEGVVVGAQRVWWWSGWFVGVGRGVDRAAVLIAEHDAVGFVGVAGDVEAAEVMVTVTASTQHDEVPRVGGAVIDPMDDVVHLQAAGRSAHRIAALLVTVQHDPAGAFRDDPLGLRPTLTGRAPSTKIGLIVPPQVYSRAIASGIAIPLAQVTAAVCCGSMNTLMR